MSTHFREECEHGWVGRRCRCMGPHPVRRVSCPKPGDPGFAIHADFVEKQTEQKKLTNLTSDSRKLTLDEVYEALRTELREANKDYSAKLKVLENPFSSHEDFQARSEAQGYSSGLARSMEIVEAMRSTTD